MKKFKFRLQRLLDLRTQQKRAIAAMLAKLQKRLRDLEEEMKTIEKEWRGRRRELMAKSSMLLRERMELSEYLEAIEHRLACMQRKRLGLLQEIEEVRSSFEMAARAEKVLEKLKERKSEEFRWRLGNAGQHMVDEIAMQKKWQQDQAGTPV